MSFINAEEVYEVQFYYTENLDYQEHGLMVFLSKRTDN